MCLAAIKFFLGQDTSAGGCDGDSDDDDDGTGAAPAAAMPSKQEFYKATKQVCS